ncbi:DNA polymerase III, subunit gamma and tau [Achromobacter sp. KAs 3-5]|nr:DNA polymerase III, subunit gamma and tau [Achromobacter sp. KAs 3-5]
MTYLVLARKWRPRSFDTLVGQDHVVRALTHALDTQRLHHAWLFTGTRGVGKTTLSRILAKSLNCETGITSKPCGVCRACTEIDAGRFVDYLELDAASNRGVEEMTQLLEQAVYAPGAGRFKVYMIDEVHMLTGHAFNAMLKTLEEPPPHVKFILATTDPQKIPVTVLSRCLQFNLKQMPADSIVGHLQAVLGQEDVGFEIPALRLIGQAASGSMRDALSLTDQAIAYSAGNLTEDAVRGMLGTIDQRHLVRLLDALSSGDAKGVLAVADELAIRGLSYAGALADLAVLLSRVAIEQRVTGVTAAEDPLAADIARLALALHPDAVQLFYSVAVHSRGELTLAPDEYAAARWVCPTCNRGTRALKRWIPPSATSSPRERLHHWMILRNSRVTGLASELARQSEWAGVQGDAIILRVAVKTLAESESRVRLQTVLCEHFGQGIRLDVRVGVTGDATAYAVAQAESAARQLAAENAVADDPFVQALLADFGGHVVPGSIRHVDSSAAA